MKYLDEVLCRLNDDYKSARKYSLATPQIKILEPKTFYDFMESIGKVGSQNKTPRVLNAQQSNKWLHVINEA